MIASTKEIPDRELSKAVAVAIMGWILCDEWRVDDGCCGIAKHCEHDRCFPAKATVWSCPPDYAGDIALAMQVVEKMREQGWQTSMSILMPPSNSWQVDMWLWQNGASWQRTQRFSESLSRAICDAAQSALATAADNRVY